MTSEKRNDTGASAAGTTTRKYYSSPNSAPKKETLGRIPEKEQPFSRANILMMLGCVALIVVGFVLMSGGGSSEEAGFNPEIFSTRRIVVGPTLAFLGFLCMAFAIIYTPASRRRKTTEKAD